MRVLIVETDQVIARALERMLRNEDVTVEPNAVTANGYDLVIGDRPELLMAMCAMPGSPPWVIVDKPMTWEALCDAIAIARLAHGRREERKPRRARRHGFVTQEL
jgi:CheY-like chemotaxis protein